MHSLKLDRDLAIAQHIQETADSIRQFVSAAYPSKRIFRKDKYDRRPTKRLVREANQVKAVMAAHMGAYQLMHLISLPIPRECGKKYLDGMILTCNGDERVYPAWLSHMTADRIAGSCQAKATNEQMLKDICQQYQYPFDGMAETATTVYRGDVS